MPIKFANKERFFKNLISIVPEAEKELTDANDRSAKALVETARRLAPVDTGKLRDSIRMRKGKRATSFIVEAGGKETTNDKNYDYAVGQEFGTVDNPAQPYFWPSYRLNRKPMKSRAARAMKKAIKAKGF